jgi:hypothetical protein
MQNNTTTTTILQRAQHRAFGALSSDGPNISFALTIFIGPTFSSFTDNTQSP